MARIKFEMIFEVDDREASVFKNELERDFSADDVVIEFANRWVKHDHLVTTNAEYED